MKILVFAHRFEVGGSQRNAIDLSATLRDSFGHDVVIFATPGPMVSVASDQGLRFIPAPYPASIPSRTMMSALRAVARQEKPDLIHVWDWWQCVDAFFAAHLLDGVPLLVTDMMSDRVTRALPKSTPTTFGTPEFVDKARALGWKRADLLLPPVDTDQNSIDAVSSREFVERYGVKNSEITIVTVSRLVNILKADSIRRSIEVVGKLGREFPIRLLLVGDGNARKHLEQLALQTNASLGRPAVQLVGEMLDPRAAYAAADIVVGMGGSALRGGAFAKPVIVVGESGFASSLTPKTADAFRYKGMFGIGDGQAENENLEAAIEALAASRDLRREMGEFARKFVVDSFSLPKVGEQLDGCCRVAVSHPTRPTESLKDALRIFGVLKFGRVIPEPVRKIVRSIEKRRIERARPQDCAL